MKPEPIEELVRRIDFPHLQNENGTWRKTGPSNKLYSLNRLYFYARMLREAGISDMDIIGMFGDLYWDAVDEFDFNSKGKLPYEKQQGRSGRRV